MDKQLFIANAAAVLKQKGFRKKGVYWYKHTGEILYCVNVQGSQWDKNDYYVNIGFLPSATGGETPSILGWYSRHRCIGREGELNISIEDFLENLDDMMRGVSCASDIDRFLKERPHARVVNQYWY